MSSSRQDELSKLLDHVLTLSAVAELRPDARIRRVHYDWLEAGEYTRRTGRITLSLTRPTEL